ncbi:unnamed protein product, partial [Brassica oleracea]
MYLIKRFVFWYGRTHRSSRSGGKSSRSKLSNIIKPTNIKLQYIYTMHRLTMQVCVCVKWLSRMEHFWSYLLMEQQEKVPLDIYAEWFNLLCFSLYWGDESEEDFQLLGFSVVF